MSSFFCKLGIMQKIKVKKEYIGKTTFVSGIGQIMITAEHAPMLFRRNLMKYLEGVKEPKKLVPTKEKKQKETESNDPAES